MLILSIVIRRPRKASRALLAAALLTSVACAEVVPSETSDDPVTTVGCSNNLTTETSILDWELDVVADTIESGKSFSASLDGVATFSEDFLDSAQPFFSGGVREVNLVDLKATVHVRSGASGPDVTLTIDESLFEYECLQGRNACDPENDLEGTLGARPNTDCQPESAANPCGRFILLPISSDCAPGGTCEELDKTGPQSQCDLNSFCITGDLQIPLGEDSGRYTADADGDVLFGWVEGETVGATLQEGGPDDGTWILPEPVYSEPAGLLALRISVSGLPAALECSMGVDSRGPLGVDSLNFKSSPTPSSALPAFPIQPPR